MSSHPSSKTTASSFLLAAIPALAPWLAAALIGAFAWRVFTGMADAGDLEVLHRALPGPLARITAAAAAMPMLPAACLALVPILASWMLPRWGSRGADLERMRVRRAVGWVWLGSSLIAVVALTGGLTGTKATLAALGYVLAWPLLVSFVVVLAIRRVTPLSFAIWTTAAVAAGLLLRALPLGLPGQNSWSYWAMLPHRPIAALLTGGFELTLALVLLIGLARVRSEAACRWGLAGLALAGLLLLRGLPRLEHYGPEKHPAALASENNTSYLQVSDRLGDAHGALRGFAALMPDLPMHGRTHPPGWPLLFRAAIGAGATPVGEKAATSVAWLLGADRSAAAALASDVAEWPLSPAEDAGLWLLVGLALLGVVTLPALVFFAARDLTEAPAAFRAAQAATLIGAPLLFFPDVDCVSPALFTLAMWAWLRSGRQGAAGWAWLSGALAAALAALSFGNLSLLAVPILMSALMSGSRPAGARSEALRLAGLLAPVAILAALLLAGGIDPFRMLAAAQLQHHVILAHRVRALWTFLDLQEFVVFFGVTLAAWLAAVTPWRALIERARARSFDPATALFVATLLTLLLLDLSGETKGEAGRIWMGFMPLLVVGTASLWVGRRLREWALLGTASLAMLVVLKGFYVFIWPYSGH